MTIKSLILLLFIFLILTHMPARGIVFLLFVAGYFWIMRLIQAGLSELGSPAPGRAGERPDYSPDRRVGPERLRDAFRWFFQGALGGTQGLPVMQALVLKEVRTLLASRKSFWLLFSLSAVASIYFIIFWQNTTLSITVATRAQFSRAIFSSLYLIQFCGLGLISAVMASATVTTERENKTLDLLLATRLSREQVVLAKWFSNIIYQFVLFAALLPIQALTFQLGGVGLDDYLAAAVLISAAIATYGMIGLAVSCHVQRTITALMLAVGVAVVVGLFVPAHRFFDNTLIAGLGAVPLYLVPLGIAFVIAWRTAWAGLAQRDTTRAAVAPPVIDDREVLLERRTTWPFYLIDPLARPQDIADGQDPVYIKEQRVSLLGRLDIIIRICYAAMFLSFVLVLAEKLSGSFEAFRVIARWEISFLMLFVPILSATGISKEHEENTLSLLRTAPLSPRRIVWAKFRLTLRFLAIVCVSLMIVPSAIHIGMSLTGNTYRAESLRVPLAAVFKITPLLLGWSALYAALALLCSSLCRRNVTAIVASYVTMLVLAVSPNILGFLAGLLDTGLGGGQHPAARWAIEILRAVRYYVCPLLSPHFFFADGAGGAEGHYFSKWESWLQLADCLALLAGGMVLLVEGARIMMVRAARRA